MKPEYKVTTISIPIDLWIAFKKLQIERQAKNENKITISKAAINGIAAEVEKG